MDSHSFPNLTVVEHPILSHYLTMMRNKETPCFEFRKAMHHIGQILAYEATKQLPLEPLKINTPFEEMVGHQIGDYVTIVPVMRAGMGMLEGLLEMIPTARVGHMGLYRHKQTKQAIEYFVKLPPDIKNHNVFLIDPLLATGNTVMAAIERIKKQSPKKIYFLCILASREALTKIYQLHPDVTIFSVSIEREMNKDAYLLPGVGDAGDRLFGTL